MQIIFFEIPGLHCRSPIGFWVQGSSGSNQGKLFRRAPVQIKETEKGNLIRLCGLVVRRGSGGACRSNRRFQILGLYWRPPESGHLWCKSRQLNKTIWCAEVPEELVEKIRFLVEKFDGKVCPPLTHSSNGKR